MKKSFCLVAGLFLAITPFAYASKSEQKSDYVGVLVGKAFLRAVSERDVSSLIPLCSKEVSFDGQIIKGTKQIRLRLKRMLRNIPAEIRFSKVIGLSFKEMEKRFGPAPKRLSKLPLGDAIFVLGRLHKGGLIVILRKVEGRYRVIGLTD